PMPAMGFCQCDSSCPGCCMGGTCFSISSTSCGVHGKGCAWCGGVGMPFNYCVVSVDGNSTSCMRDCGGCWNILGSAGNNTTLRGTCMSGMDDHACGHPWGYNMFSQGECQDCGSAHCVDRTCR